MKNTIKRLSMAKLFLMVVFLPVSISAAAAPTASTKTQTLESVIAADHRTEKFVKRDIYRHPVQTLNFFRVQADLSVLEIWPGSGWYTEILAPYLKDNGVFYAAHFPSEAKGGYYQKSRVAFEQKLAADTSSYGAVQITDFSPSNLSLLADGKQVDRVLTFRNVHNWMKGDNEAMAIKAFHGVLKTGGLLGIVEHRAKPGTSKEQMIGSGYVTEAYVIELAEKAGFTLLEKSEINANPKDNATHAKGVWTLPPSLRLGDEDRAKYLSIGESDRMTLLFKKTAM